MKKPKVVPCKICGTKILSSNYVKDIFVNGHKIWLCNNPECHKKFTRLMRDDSIDKNRII